MWVDLSDKPPPAQATNMSHHHNLNTYKAHWTIGKRNFLRREATSTNYFVHSFRTHERWLAERMSSVLESRGLGKLSVPKNNLFENIQEHRRKI